MSALPQRPALPLTIPLRQYLGNLYREAEAADWAGDTKRARFLEAEAVRTIADGEDPVIMF